MQKSAATGLARRIGAIAMVLCAGLPAVSCSGFVADNWPHFAGGEPAGLPPRPGSPGYAEYIAHQNALAAGGESEPKAAANPPSVTPAAAVQTSSVNNPPPVVRQPQSIGDADQNVGNGGLY